MHFIFVFIVIIWINYLVSSFGIDLYGFCLPYNIALTSSMRTTQCCNRLSQVHATKCTIDSRFEVRQSVSLRVHNNCWSLCRLCIESFWLTTHLTYRILISTSLYTYWCLIWLWIFPAGEIWLFWVSYASLLRAYCWFKLLGIVWLVLHFLESYQYSVTKRTKMAEIEFNIIDDNNSD